MLNACIVALHWTSREHQDVPDTRSTILPTWAPASMRALASFSCAKSVDLVDLGLDAPRGDMGHHFGDESRHRSRSLFLAAQLVRNAEQREPLRVQGAEIDVGVKHAIDISHRGKPAFERKRPNILGEHRAADRIDDEVGALLVRFLHDPRREVARARAQADIEPQGP